MTGPDLRAVDELCRLALAARRLGCRVRILDADPALVALLDLAGLTDVLVTDEPGWLGPSHRLDPDAGEPDLP